MGVHKHPCSQNLIFLTRSLYNMVLPNIMWSFPLALVSRFWPC